MRGDHPKFCRRGMLEGHLEPTRQASSRSKEDSLPVNLDIARDHVVSRDTIATFLRATRLPGACARDLERPRVLMYCRLEQTKGDILVYAARSSVNSGLHEATCSA
jgi:hypothetical protein